MGLEKRYYHLNLELLNNRYPDHDMLSVSEVLQATGYKDRRTLQKYLGTHIAGGRISKSAVAQFMSTERR